MLVETIIEEDNWTACDLDGLAQSSACAVLAHFSLNPADFEISLLGCDDARIMRLNGDFRDRPMPTNVLSWPSEERGAPVEGMMPELPEPEGEEAVELGDIAIAFQTCAREAQAVQRKMADHVQHLIVHGVLHLLGFDHIRDKDATLMQKIEIKILGKLGVPDPYGQ